MVNDPMEAAYVGVKLWAQAVREAGSAAVHDVRRALRGQRLAAPDGEVRVDPDTQHCFKTPRVGRIRADGQFEVVWSAAGPVEPAPYPETRTSEQWRSFLFDLHAGWGHRWAAPVN